ncbi:MAG: cytosine permease, partial [Patescibacteria group bacterium]|nr:cytosine permease [Patescibacteria group bacterium]
MAAGLGVALGSLVVAALAGIAGATILAGGLALLIVAGAHGAGKSGDLTQMDPTSLMSGIVGPTIGKVFMYLLAIAAFPSACFSAFIAANSFKTTLPKVNPFITVGLGTLVSIALAVTGWAAQVQTVFGIIGASFGPVCGAMMADYMLSGRKWAGPRAGFNMAGWISWLVGFCVGAFNGIVDVFMPSSAFAKLVPVPPLSALVIGFLLYFILAKIGLQSRVLPMPQRIDNK